MVFHGRDLVLTIERDGRALEFTVEPGLPQIQKYLEVFKTLLTREFNPLSAVRVEKINGIAAAESPYKEDLKKFGFQASYKGLELWKY